MFYASTCYVWLGDDDRAEERAREVITQHVRPEGSTNAPMRLSQLSRAGLGLPVKGRSADEDGTPRQQAWCVGRALRPARRLSRQLLDEGGDRHLLLRTQAGADR